MNMYFFFITKTRSRDISPTPTDLVAADPGRLQRLRRQLLILVRDEMDAQRKLIDTGLLAAEVKDADLRIRDPAAETGLWVGLVLAVAVTSGRAATHLGGLREGKGANEDKKRRLQCLRH